MSQKWTAGDEWSAGNMNLIREELQLQFRPPEIWVRRLASQSITAVAGATPYPMVAIVFDTMVKDTHSMWGPGGDLSAVEIPRSGWYDVNYGIGWTANTTNVIHSFALSVNGTLADTSTSTYVDPTEITRGEMRNYWTGSGWITRVRKTYPAYFTEGDVLRLRTSSTVNSTTETSSGNRPTLRLKWVSQ